MATAILQMKQGLALITQLRFADDAEDGDGDDNMDDDKDL